MIYVLHRINKIKLLKSIPIKYGVEVDLRSSFSNLIIQHEPFNRGEKFNDWLEHFKHKLLIINIKEEGLEPYIFQELKRFKIKNFFFLDQSFPFMLKYSKLLSKKSAIRFSEFENIQTSLSVKKYVSWIWIDCFKKLPLNKRIIKEINNNNFKTSLVSPELQGRDPVYEIPLILKKISRLNFKPDVICTKHPHLWEKNNF